MPEIGEIKKGQELDYPYPDNFKRIYIACPECKKSRWVRVIKGKPTAPRCRTCTIRATKHQGKNHYNWKGGQYQNSYGYIETTISADNSYFSMAPKPNGNRISYILEHRLIMAKYLHRCLEPYEHIHHKNGIRNDNRIENLELTLNGQHIKAHHQGYQDGYRQGYTDGKDNKIKALTLQIKRLEDKLCSELDGKLNMRS